MTPATRSDLPARLREALQRAGFTYDAVAELLGPLAHAALSRNETTPGPAGHPAAARPWRR